MLEVETAILTFEQVELMCGWAFGDLGRQTAQLWRQYNADYFAGELHPAPIIYVPVSPYGHWIGLHHGRTVDAQRSTALIYLMRGRSWPLTRGILLHEMIHQHLNQRGEDVHHDGAPWRAEITRISDTLGTSICATGTKVAKVKQADGAWKSQRQRRPSSDGREPMGQDEIAAWPHSMGIVPPDLEDERPRPARDVNPSHEHSALPG